MTDPIKFNLIHQPPEKLTRVLVPFIQGSDVKSNLIPDQAYPGFTGNSKETFQVYLADRQQQVVLLGLGMEKQLPSAYQAFRHAIIKNRPRLAPDLLVDLRHLPDSLVYQCVLGLSLANYTLGVYKTEENGQIQLKQVEILVSELSEQKQALVEEAQHCADVVKSISALVDAPGNIKTPRYLGQHLKQSGTQFHYQVEVLDQQALKKENLQALIAVGKASEHPPILIEATYKHPDRDPSKIDLGLVGKGVTFDTGGLSLKKPTNMHYMKSDMGGAAAVMGAIELIARLQLPLNVAAVIPVAENSVDASSIRPGDVIQSHSGKSIEIIDTDAEGRLILADALSYIQEHYNPDTLIDLATLTGSCVAALGYEAAGLFTNDHQLADALSEVGELTGERVWRLPLWDGYKDALDSDIADVKNLSGKPVAGAITAAKFLEYFVKDQQKWAHMDIAGVAFGDTDYAKMKSSTGYGVRLLVEFARHLITT